MTIRRPAGEPSNIASITADSNGNVYAVGLARQGTFAGIVRKSSDGGRTWTLANWTTGLPNDAAADEAGNVYVIAGFNGRVLRKSADGGATWVDIDRIPMRVPARPIRAIPVSSRPARGTSSLSARAATARDGSCGAAPTPAEPFNRRSRFSSRPASQPDCKTWGSCRGRRLCDRYWLWMPRDASHWVVVRGAGAVSDQFALAAGQIANGLRLRRHGPACWPPGSASDGQATFGVVRRRDAHRAAGRRSIDFPRARATSCRSAIRSSSPVP